MCTPLTYSELGCTLLFRVTDISHSNLHPKPDSRKAKPTRSQKRKQEDKLKLWSAHGVLMCTGPSGLDANKVTITTKIYHVDNICWTFSRGDWVNTKKSV